MSTFTFYKNNFNSLTGGLTKILMVLLTVLYTNSSNAQINYTRTTFSGGYTPITTGGGATQILLGANTSDFSTTGGIASGTEGVANIPMPFDFSYNGTAFLAGFAWWGIGTNGYIYPTTTNTNLTKIISNVNTNLFITSTPNSTIAPYWDDLTIGTAINGNTGTVLYQTDGVVGSRVFTVQYTNVPAFSSGNVVGLNFQVKIYETSNIIEFVYGPRTNGTAANQYNLSETASIGIESSLGGNLNYIDAVTGSKTANTSMITSNKFPTLLNFRFTPGAPSPIPAGTYNVGVGQTYPSLSEAAADLNHRGVSGAVTMNLTDAVYDTSVVGGKNIFPIVTSTIAGTSVTNTVTISRIGSHADLRYRGTDNGNLGNQASTAIIAVNFEPILAVIGTDFMTVNNVDFTYNGVQGGSLATLSYFTNGKVDCAIGLINSSSTDGATNNTFSNFVCTNDRTNPASTQAIRHVTQTTPTSAAGANGGNTYMDFVIKNGTSGFLISATSATFPDINNRIITSSCNTYNIIGDPSVPNDLSNITTATAPFGITMGNQSGFTVSNNKITNITNLSTSSLGVIGINVTTFAGTGNTISNNIIKNIRQNTPSATASLNVGIQITNTTTLTNDIRVYNNAVSGITSAFNGTATTTRIILGISCASTTNTLSTYHVYNNSISIDGSTSLNGSNACFQVAGTLGPVYHVRNNILANFTAAQVTARHNCYNTNSSTVLGGTGSTVWNNDLFIANDAGVSGFIGYNTSLLTGSNPLSTFNTAYSSQVSANVSGDPMFFNNSGNLHATNSGLLSGTGTTPPVYVTTDLDCNPRTSPHHIGAYLVGGCPSGVPTVTTNPAGTACSGFPISGTTSAASPQYQWSLNGVEIFGATSGNYTPTLSGTYVLRVNNTGEGCFGVSAAVTINQSPTITLTPAVAAVCDGQTVNLNTTVTNNPPVTYTVTSIPFIDGYSGALTNGALLPGGPGLTVGALGDEGNYNVPQNSSGAATTLPWSFNFFGTAFNQFTVHANGQILMGANRTEANSVFSPPAIPSVANPNNWAGFWADLSVNATDQIRWDMTGVAPNRKLIVRFTNVAFFSATPFITYQIELNETSGFIDVFLTTVNGITNTKAIGIENATGSLGYTPVGRNSGTWTAVNEGWRFAPVPPPAYSYSWSPATGLTSSTISNPVSTPVLGNTIYTVTVANLTNGCTVSATSSITNLGVADPAPSTVGDSICAGETGNLNASGLSTLNWYNAATGGTLVNTGTTWSSAFPSTATYYVESFNGNCPSPRTPVTITVTPLPVLSPTATPNSFCSGDSSQLDAGTFLSGILATPLNQNNGSSATGFDITNIAAVPVTLHFFQFQSSSTAGTVGVQQIWMNTTPMNCVFPANVTTAPGWVQIANVSTTSAGTSPILTTIPFDVNITIPPGATYAFAIGGALGQSYTSGTSGCPIMGSTAHLTVKEGFGGTLTGTIANRRWNGTVTYAYGDTALSFAWTPATGLSATNIKTPKSNPPVGTTVYTCTIVNTTTGCTNTGTVSVTNLGVADPAPVGVSNSLCGTGTINLTATGLSTLRWYDVPVGGSVLGTGSPFTTPFLTVTDTFYVESYNGNCPSPRAMVIATIKTVTPTIVNFPTSTICLGSSVGLSAINQSTITYSQVFTNGASTIAQCQAWDIFTNSLVPGPYTKVKMWGDGGVGVNSPVALAGREVTNPATVQAIAAALRTRTAEINFPAADQFGNTWRVGLSCGSGCGSPIATVELNADNNGTDCSCITPGWCFRPNLTGSNSGGINTATCSGPTQTMNLEFTTGSPASAYAWSPAAGLSCTDCSNPTASPTVTTTYTVVATLANGCTSSTTAVVNVLPAPPSPTINTSTTFCGCGTSSLTATANGVGTTIYWYDVPTGGTLLASGPSYTTYLFCGVKTFYAAEVDNVSGCESIVRTPVTITPITATSIAAGADAILCDGGGPASFTATSANPNYAYSWSPASGLNATTGATVLAGPISNTTYIVTGFDSGTGCVSKDTVTVTVGTTPVINSTTATPGTVCEGDTTQLAVAAQFPGGNPPTSGFNGSYIPATWTIVHTGADLGSVSSHTATTLTMVSSDGGSGATYIDVRHTITGTGNITFNWDYNTVDGAPYDYPMYYLNGLWTAMPGYSTGGATTQSGTASIPVVAGDVFGFSMYSADNVAGAATSNFTNVVFPGSVAAGTLDYSWSPSTGLSSSTIANPKATLAAGTTIYTVTVSNNGCTVTSTVSVTANQTPAAPIVDGDTVCGPNIVNLSAVLSTLGNQLVWTDTIGGQIINSGTTYSPYVTKSGSYYVREVGSTNAAYVGYNGTSTLPVGYFPDVASFLNFTVHNPEGLVINSVEVSTNLAAGLYPLVVALMSPTGQIISVHDTVYISGGNTALQTVTLNMFVPPGTWRLQPIANPNLSVHQNATVQGTAPWTIPGWMTISCFGNANSACFATNTYGLFYNWNVSTACYGPSVAVNYIVNDPPPVSISSRDGQNFCGPIATTLSAVDTIFGGYDTFAWSPATGLNNTTGTPVTVSGVPSTITYTLTATDNGTGCVNVVPITLNFNPDPTLLLAYHDTTVCSNVDTLLFDASAAKSSIVQLGTRIDPNFVNGQVYGGNTTQFSQMLFTPAELNAAGLVGPTQITSLAFHVAGKLYNGTYTANIAMRADVGVPAVWPSAAHINTGLTTVYTNPAVTSVLGWNTYNFSVPFSWNGTSNVLVSVCFTHNTPSFFDIVSTSNAGAVRFNALNASACNAATGALATINPNDRPNVRFTGGTVLYSWLPSAGLNASTIEDPKLGLSSITPNTTTQYTITITDPVSGCSKVDSLRVTRLSVPPAPLSGGNLSRCGYGSVNLTATAQNGYTLRWYGDSLSNTIIGSGSPFAFTTGVSDTVWVEEWNGGCRGPRTRVIVTVNPAPAATASGVNVPICDGNGPGTLNVTSSNPNYQYSWTPATNLSATTGSSVSANPAVPTTYTVLAYDPGTQCQDTAVIFVGVGNAVPIPSISATPSAYCIGGVSQLNVPLAVGAYSAAPVSFSPIAVPLGSPSPTSGDDAASGAIALPFTFNFYGVPQTQCYIYTNGFVQFGAYSGNTTTYGSLIPNAAAPNNLIAVCWEDLNPAAGQVTYFTSGVAPYRIFVVDYNAVNYWSATPGVTSQLQIHENNGNNFFQIHVTNNLQSGNSTVIGCEDAAGVSGTVPPGRQFGAWLPQPTVNEAWQFNPPVQITFSWSPATGLSNSTVSNPFASPATSTNYTCTVTNTLSGCTSTASVAVNVYPIPTAPAVTGPTTHCGPAVLTLTVSGTDTVKWYDASFGGNLLNVGTSFTTLVSGTTTYYVERTNGFCSNAGGRIPYTVTITTPPAMSAAVAPASVCAGDSAVLSIDGLTVGNFNTYTWYGSNLSNTSGSSVKAAPANTTTYTVVGSNPGSGDPSCTNAATLTVTVNPLPIISSIIASPQPTCSGDSVQFTTTASIPGGGGVGNYSLAIIPHAPLTPEGPVTTLATGGVAVTPQSVASLDDGTWDNLALPVGFAFNYYGTTPTTFSVSTNGFMTFGASGGAFCCSGQFLPNVGSPNNYLAMAHEDWLLSVSGTLDYFVNGTAPFRKFVFRATAVPRFGGTGAPSTGQIILYETLNTIEFHITSITTASGDATTMAIEDPIGNFSVVVAGRNSNSPWTATNEGWRFSPPSQLTYAWTPASGFNNTSIANPKVLVTSSSTVYTVTVANSSTGCTKTGTLTVSLTPPPTPRILEAYNTDSIVQCSDIPGIMLHVTDTQNYPGGYPAGTLFEWVNYTPPTLGLDTLFANSPDNYTCIVTLPGGIGGCDGQSDTIYLDLSTAAPLQVMGQDTIKCNGDNNGNAIGTIAFGGTPPFRYIWKNSSYVVVKDTVHSDFADTLFNLPPGWYHISIEDKIGSAPPPPHCTIYDSVYVYEPGVLTAYQAGSTEVDCNGNSTGAIDLAVVDGSPEYFYLWNNGSTDEDISGLAAGIYTVTVTDYHGCTTTATATVVQPLPLASNCTFTDVTINGANNGTATSTPTGGTAPYTYLWDNGATTLNTTGLSPGVYCVTVTDAHGCTSTCCVTISEPLILTAVGTATNITCKNAHNGTITMNPIGGVAPYTYVWSNFQTTQTISGLYPGTYCVTVTDASGAVATNCFTIIQPTVLLIDIQKTNVRCGGKCTGKATATPTGGWGGYAYLWSNGQTTSNIANLCAGTYTVTVSDAGGCVKVISFNITQNPVLSVIAAPSGPSSATASAGGGVAPYTYQWNTVPIQTTATATGLSAGSTYKVRVTDVKGCTKTALITMPLPKAASTGGDEFKVFAHPNPTYGLINLSFNTLEGFDYTVRLFDLAGREVFMKEMAKETGGVSHMFDFSDLPRGLYQLSVQSVKGKAVIKIVLD